MILDVHVPRQRRGVGEDRMAAHLAVVGHVRGGHEQVLVADRRRASAARRSGVDGAILPELIVPPDAHARPLATVFEILRLEAHGAEREEAAGLADLGVALNDDVGEQLAPRPQADAFPDHAEGTDAASLAEPGGRMHLRARMYFGAHGASPRE